MFIFKHTRYHLLNKTSAGVFPNCVLHRKRTVSLREFSLLLLLVKYSWPEKYQLTYMVWTMFKSNFGFLGLKPWNLYSTSSCVLRIWDFNTTWFYDHSEHFEHFLENCNFLFFTFIVRRGLQPEFFISPSTRAISVVTAVPVEASTAPYTQASRWLPIKTYLSGSSRP